MHFDISVITNNWQLFLAGAALTVAISAMACLVGFLVAIPLALCRLNSSRILSAAATSFVETFRNIPFIVVVFLFFYGFPALDVAISSTLTGVIALSVFASAYYCEIIRAAILSVPAGQLMAARAVGMSYMQGLREVVVPQMPGNLIPSATNTTITFIKETSVLSAIAVAELTYQGLIVQGNTFAAFEVFAATALIYWAITGLFGHLMGRLEYRLQASKRTTRHYGPVAARFLSLDHRVSS